MQPTDKLTALEIEQIINAAAPDQALLQQFQMDNETAKRIAMMIAGKIPKVGGVLSVLMSLFWPSDEVSIWDQIKDKVEALVDQKIAANNLAKLRRDLKGIQINLNNYQRLSDKAQKQSALQSVNTTIEAMIPSFLSGDVASGFSCFWGIALLHLAVRKELWELYQDQANEDLLREYTLLYCKFGRVALSTIYNSRLDKLKLDVISTNEPGKASNWIIEVKMTDEGQSIYQYSKYFRFREWNTDVLNNCTVECNQRLAVKWSGLDNQLKIDLASWAYEAIIELEKEYRFTENQLVTLVKGAMEESDYTTYAMKYYPNESMYHHPQTSEPVKRTPVLPFARLNPF